MEQEVVERQKKQNGRALVYCLEGAEVENIPVVIYCTNFGTGLKLPHQK